MDKGTHVTVRITVANKFQLGELAKANLRNRSSMTRLLIETAYKELLEEQAIVSKYTEKLDCGCIVTKGSDCQFHGDS